MVNLNLPYPKLIDYAVPGKRQYGVASFPLPAGHGEILQADDRKRAGLTDK